MTTEVRSRIINASEDLIASKLDKETLKHILENDLVFQAISWYSADFSEINEENEERLSHQIYIHGRMIVNHDRMIVNHDRMDSSKNISMCLRVLNFTPYFYLEIPQNWTNIQLKRLETYIREYLKNLEYGLESVQLVLKKKLYPFTAGTEFKFAKLVFKNTTAFKKVQFMFADKDGPKNIRIPAIGPTSYKFNVYESNVDPINRFCHIQDIKTTGFIKIEKGKFNLETHDQCYDNESQINNYEPHIYTRSQLAINSLFSDVNSIESDEIIPIKVFSWDIECQSSNGEDFPDPKKETDYIGQIGVTLWSYGLNKKTKFIVTNRKCSPVEDVIVLDTNSEIELIKTFCTLLELLDPDIITGYNTWGFDDNYLFVRMSLLGLTNEMNKFSRLTKVPSTLKQRRLSSGAYGDNEFNVLECHGRETFDLLIAIRREHKLGSYKLDAVGRHFTGQAKEDLPYKEVFKKMKGSPDEVSEVAKYCVQDTNLVVEIMDNQSIIPNYFEMAKITYVPVSWLLFRGQQCKVFSLVAKESRARGFVIPSKIEASSREFKGASVRSPLRGCYYVPVAGLDFSSLYPSIMIAHNLCYSTIVTDEKYLNLPGYTYESITWLNDNSDGSTTNFNFSFVQHKNEAGEVVGEQGILPSVLTKLWSGRKDTKKRMKTEKNPEKYKVLNGKQLAQKVTMNSVYGFTGTGENGMLSCKEIASSVTARGRQMIAKTAKLAEEFYPCTTLYGDSIPSYERVYISDGQNDFSKTQVSELTSKIGQGSLWTDYRFFKNYDKDRFCKEQIDLTDMNYFTMTASGPTKLKRIIRHKAPDKKLYRVTVKDSNGLLRNVIVTEGHSLISENGDPIQADTLKEGSLLFNVSQGS